LIDKVFEMGYVCTLGDLFRDQRVFGPVGTQMGYGHPKSAHKVGLALDINLFFPNGVYIRDDTGHSEVHDYWDSVGGAKRIPDDSNHYSLEHEGMK
jgi:hypothetical protein